jgi:peptidyl-prolyl cis-trans isomerase B (cyclophilin B)
MAVMVTRVLIALAFTLGQAASQPAFFKSPYSLDEMKHKQAVVETTMGTFVLALMPEVAPNHVGHFIKLAKDGAYAGTSFFRVVKYGIIQGGDPLTKDPTKAATLYGTGGMNQLKPEFSSEKYTAGTVAAVLAPGKPDSGGSQFFVCVTDQLQLTDKYTVFARVVEGIEIVEQISAVAADRVGRPATRIDITSVTIRDTPPPVVPPFTKETAAELGAYRAILETTKGAITLELLADRAPETVRQFLRLAAAGVYDNSPFHRVVKGFVLQSGSMADRPTPLNAAQAALIHNLQPEFSPTENVPGMVSMARGDDPASASTSFFICAGECHALDNKYTAFARVVAGLDVVAAIEAVDVQDERPKELVAILRVRIEKKP